LRRPGIPFAIRLELLRARDDFLKAIFAKERIAAWDAARVQVDALFARIAGRKGTVPQS
jgi:hypothetical protein